MHILPLAPLSSQCIEAQSGAILDQSGAFDAGVVPHVSLDALYFDLFFIPLPVVKAARVCPLGVFIITKVSFVLTEDVFYNYGNSRLQL